MHLRRFTTFIICVLILLSVFIVNATSAEDNIKTFVEATFTVKFVSGIEIKLNVSMDVSQIMLISGNIYTAEEIQILANANSEIMGAIKYALKETLLNQIRQTFDSEKATVDSVYELPSYVNNKFYDDFNVNLTSSFFGLNSSVNVNDFINGILDMSALLNYTLNLYAEPGWNNTYLIDLGDTLNYQQTTGGLSGDNIFWTLKNWNGATPNKQAEIQIKKKNPTTKTLSSENIFLDFELDSRNVKTTSLTSNVLLKDVDIRPYNALPSFVSNLDYVPADGIRLLIENGFFTWDNFYQKTVEPLEKKIKSTIENSPFNQTLDLTFKWDNETTSDCLTPYDTSNMDDSPYAKAILKDDRVNLKLCGVSSRGFFGLINSGAKANISKEDINFGGNLENLGYDSNITLYLPEKLYLDEKNIFTWNTSSSVLGEFKSDTASPQYTKPEKNTVIEIEIKNTDLNILSFLTGNTELKFEIDLREYRNYNVTTIPEEFVGEFISPGKMSLDYLNSDAFRLCIEENIFSGASVNRFLDDEKNAFESILRHIIPNLQVSGNVNRGVFDESLQWDGNISNMDANTPVKVANSAHTSYPIHFGLGAFPPQFSINTQYLNFTGLKDQDVTYRIIFPQGINVDAGDSLNKVHVWKLEDGRCYLEISFSASEANLTDVVSCKMIPSVPFILGVLTPCIISLIVVIILIVVVIIVRKKRRNKGKKISKPEKDVEKEGEEETSYEGEDYYIPPPPGSK